MPEHLFGNTSEKDMVYSCSTVRAQNNNIYIFFLCKFEYLIILPAGFGNGFKFNLTLYLFYIALLIVINQIFFYPSLYLN